MSENNKKPIQLGFAALFQEVEDNIPSSDEKKIKGKEFISFGTDNKYPEFLFSLYRDCATLQSIINGTVDYVKGNRIVLQGQDNKIVNRKEETITDVLEKCISDYLIYGFCYFQVIRNKAGQVSELYWLDAAKVRTNETNDVFYYSEDWTKTYGRVVYTEYPKFSPDSNLPSSIVMIKTPQSRGVYGTAMYSGAIKSALTEIKISDFHLNEISNNFLGSSIINFCNGRPSDEQKEEIEEEINEKFAGAGNAGRMLLSFNESEKNKTTVERLGTDDFDSRYNDLAKHTREQIFVSFRAQPILFGLTSEVSTGFSTEEFEQTFSLFSRTVVKPIQDRMIDVVNKIFGAGSIEIEPFSLNVQNKVE